MRTVATKTDVTDAIDEFVRLLTCGIRVEYIVLYGSYVNGTPNEWSDFDVAVISPDFEGRAMWERQRTIAWLDVSCDRRISPIGYPTSEYRNPGRHSFLGEIIRTGRVIYSAE